MIFVTIVLTMIDIQLLRKDIDAVAAGLKTRNFELDVATFNALETQRRQLQTQTEEMQARRNALSKQIGILKSKKEDTSAVMAEVGGIGEKLKANETALSELQAKLSEFYVPLSRISLMNRSLSVRMNRPISRSGGSVPREYSISK